MVSFSCRASPSVHNTGATRLTVHRRRIFVPEYLRIPYEYLARSKEAIGIIPVLAWNSMTHFERYHVHFGARTTPASRLRGASRNDPPRAPAPLHSQLREEGGNGI